MPRLKKEAPTKPVQAFPSTFASRGPGLKEPPPFKWKLVAESDGFNVVLLKVLEKKEAEAAMMNLKEQGLYERLQIHPLEAKIPQPKLVAIRLKERKEEERQAKIAAQEAEKKKKAKELEKKKKTQERERLARKRERVRARNKVRVEKQRLRAERQKEAQRKKKEALRRKKSASKPRPHGGKRAAKRSAARARARHRMKKSGRKR